MNDKQLVAIEASKLVQDGMVVGLGTGSTANYFIEALAQRQQQGLKVRTIASSTISAMKATACGLTLIDFAQVTSLDLYVDGADEISPQLTLLKGRGQDLVMEKLLAYYAKTFVVVADNSKLVSRIGENFVIPIEVKPHVWQMVKAELQSMGATGDIRLNAAQDNIAVTASGSYVLDMRFPIEYDEKYLNELLNTIPGIVEHGIFYGLTSQVLIANQGKLEIRQAD